MKQREKIFKGDHAGLWITKGLFLEMSYNIPDYAIYTLKVDDHNHHDGYFYQSLYKLYIACDDPTEYEFANKHLGGWEHWEKLCECVWFQPHVEKWRREMEIKLRSKGLKEIILEAENGGKNSYEANKFLANANWKPKELATPGKRGRPSKEEIKQEALAQIELEKRIQEDLNRVKVN